MKAADHIALSLERHGVTHAYELVGGMITFLLDALHRRGNIRIVSMHHEQGAGFAAEGHGRITGRPAVAFATSGPGATNLLTAVGSCYFDSVPAVFITGQVNRHEQRGDRPIRQLGFQETDIVPMARPITKAAWLVNDPAELPALLDKAFALAVEGRPGPVLLDIPMDVQRADVSDEVTETAPVAPVAPVTSAAGPFLARLEAALAVAKRPLILAGGGCSSPVVRDAFRRFADRAKLPVVLSLMGVDALPAAHPCRVGMLGSYGNRWVNKAIAEADFLLVLGSRLDVRQTGADIASFTAGKRVFHVDVESGEMNNRVTGCDTLVADLNAFFAASEKLVFPPVAPEWTDVIGADRKRWPDTRELADVGGINPNDFLKTLSESYPEASAYVTDVGQHQMWAAQSLRLSEKQRFLTSGGMGAMGFGLPAAIGAAFATGKPVVLVAGDGGMQLNIQELQTIVRNRLPVKMIVLDNGCHGMVRQFQESYFHGRYQSTLWGYDAPDFVAVANAYGIGAMCVCEPADIPAAIAFLRENPETPALLEVTVSPMANAYPKMAFGKPISEMEPFSKPLEMEGT